MNTDRPSAQRTPIARFASSVALVLLLSGCGGGGGEPNGNPPPPGDTAPPTVTTVFPVNGAAQIATNATLLATFSEAMNPATLTAATFTLSAAGGAPVAGTVALNGTTATFTPAASLSSNTQYTSSISTGARDAAGNALASAHAWSFTTAAAADTTPPTVSSVMPTDGATGVPISATVRATFSEPLNPSSLSTNTFSVVETSTSAALPGAVTVSGSTATFAPSAPLAVLTHYTATAGTGVQDLAGNGLTAPHTWSFTTSNATAPSVGESDLRFTELHDPATQLATAPMTTQATGSVIVVGMANGSITSLQTPTDNKGNGYVQEGIAHAYTLWPTSGTALYVATTVNGGGNHIVTGLQNSGDEMTIAAVEIRNATRVTSVWREDLASPLTSASIETEGPAVLIAFWWGDGNASMSHTAVPSGDFTVIESVLRQGALVQCAVATRTVASAGTYDVTWVSSEGAQLWLIAVE